MLREFPLRAVDFASEPETFFFAAEAVAEALFGDAAFGEFFAAEGFAGAVFAPEAEGFFFAEPLD